MPKKKISNGEIIISGYPWRIPWGLFDGAVCCFLPRSPFARGFIRSFKLALLGVQVHTYLPAYLRYSLLRRKREIEK